MNHAGRGGGGGISYPPQKSFVPSSKPESAGVKNSFTKSHRAAGKLSSGRST